jgi:beta-N-acetylhexosaminidase
LRHRFQVCCTFAAASLAALACVGAYDGTGSATASAAGRSSVAAGDSRAGNGRATISAARTAAVSAVKGSQQVPSLSPLQLAGQRVIYSYQGKTPPASLLSAIRNGEAAGVIFFGGNIASRAQIRSVISQLEAANASPRNPARKYPLLLMTDQEGGEVRRLPGAPKLSEKQIGEIKPLSAAEAAARSAGKYAAARQATSTTSSSAPTA